MADLMVRLLEKGTTHKIVLSILPTEALTEFDSFCTSHFASFKGNMKKIIGKDTPQGCNLFTDDPVFLRQFKQDLRKNDLLYYEKEIYSDVFKNRIKFLIVRMGDDDFRIIHEMSSKNLMKIIRN